MPRELGIFYKPDMHLAIREDRKTQTRRIIRPGRSQSWLTAEALGKVVRMEPSADGWWKMAVSDGHIGSVRSPYLVGDLLYVKEAFRWVREGPYAGSELSLFYRLDGKPIYAEYPDDYNPPTQHADTDHWGYGDDALPPGAQWGFYTSYGSGSPLHMPKWAARTWLEVTGVRAERLQDISEADAIAEGIAPLFSAQERASRPEYDVDGYRNYLWHGWVGKTITQKQADAWPHQYSSYDTARGSYSSLWESFNGPGSWAANPWVWVYEFKRIKR